ncbi:unnamed protein product, partial [Caretta caretta]
ACALDSYIAVVYEHSVILSEDTKIPVSPEDDLMLMNKNLDVCGRGHQSSSPA